MRALSLDYRRTSRTQHWIGVLVLILMVAGAVQMGLYYRRVTGQVTRLDTLATKIEHKLHPSQSAAPPSADEMQQTKAEIKLADEVMMQLKLPWDALFGALEKANSDDIALLGIEPDAKKGLVRVSGEAKDFAALFAYIRHLQESEAISAVYLRHHQIQEEDPEHPVRFRLEASWTGKR